MRALVITKFLTRYMQIDAILFDIILSQALYHSEISLSLQMGVLYHNGLEVASLSALLCEFQCGSYESTSHLKKGHRASPSFSDWYTAARSPSSHRIGLIVLVSRSVNSLLFFLLPLTCSSSNRYLKENRSLEALMTKVNY